MNDHKAGRILIVDDAPANLRLLMNILAERGYTVHPATKGEQALRFVASTLPDLILLDILMPEMDGFQVCERLKANERTRDIPIIFISAVDQVLDKVKAFRVGGVDYIVKPFQAEEVLARIETHLSLRHLQQSLEDRVQERTAELVNANVRLQEEITERRQAEERLQARQRYLSLLNDITCLALETTDFLAMLQTLAERLGELFHADGTNITLWDDTTETTIPIATSVPEMRQTYPFGRSEPGELTLTASVLRARHTLAVHDITASPYLSSTIAANCPFHSILALPLIADEQKLGAVLITFYQTHLFTPDEIAHGEHTARLIALAVAKTKLLDELEQRVAERTHKLTEANEQLKELDRLKDQFVTNVSHDLRTPLTNITLYLDLLKKRGAEKLDAYLPILQRETKRLTRLIEGLLTLSRLDMGRLTFAPEPYVLDSLLDEVLQAHAVRAADKGLQVIHEPNPDAPVVAVDYTQMMQVFTNLISNAVAYTPPEGRVVCSVNAAAASHVVITISNSGPAIPPEDLPHLFERFYRGRTGHQSGETGTGLGLAICKEIVERHGGMIEVESTEIQGTTFRVWLLS